MYSLANCCRKYGGYMNCTFWIPVIISSISAFIAVISAIVAISRANSAKKTYNLQKTIFDAGTPCFQISDIMDCFLVDDKNDDAIKYVFVIMLSNLSDKPNSISKIRLRLRFGDSDLFLTPVDFEKIIEHDEFVKVPINLSPRSSMQCTLGYSLPRKRYDNDVINSYAIIAHDIDQNESIKGIIYVREVYQNYDFKG